MDSRVYALQSEYWDTRSDAPSSGPSTKPVSYFATIPPEREGLNGEYDHSGLAKRVFQLFRDCFNRDSLEHLTVTQRGRVVVLSGYVHSQKILTQLIHAALTVRGSLAVETYGVNIVENESQGGVDVRDSITHETVWI